jgi:hypothetical protein
MGEQTSTNLGLYAATPFVMAEGCSWVWISGSWFVDIVNALQDVLDILARATIGSDMRRFLEVWKKQFMNCILVLMRKKFLGVDLRWEESDEAIVTRLKAETIKE